MALNSLLVLMCQ